MASDSLLILTSAVAFFMGRYLCFGPNIVEQYVDQVVLEFRQSKICYISSKKPENTIARV